MLFFAEWSVRLALPAYDPGGQIAWQFHPEAGVVLGRPDSHARQIKNSGDYDVAVAFNRYGFRDAKDIATGTAADTYVVGDSFTTGWGVKAGERFSDVLGDLTGKRVFNLGASLNVDGYEKVLACAERKGAKIRTLIPALNLIDDVNVYLQVERSPLPARAEKSQAGSQEPPLTLAAIKGMLLRESAIYFLVTTSVNHVTWLRRGLIRLGLIKTIDRVAGGQPGPKAIASTADHLVALARKYDLTILLIPSRGLWLGNARDRTASMHDGIRSALEGRGLRVVDPRPMLESGGKPLRYHFRNDGHWNPAGHRVAATVLAKALAAAR